jgi:hypothetical protein
VLAHFASFLLSSTIKSRNDNIDGWQAGNRAGSAIGIEKWVVEFELITWIDFFRVWKINIVAFIVACRATT